MRVAIGGQGSAFELKEAVKKHLQEKGYEVCDMGQKCAENKDFFFLDSVNGVAEQVKNGTCDRGILMCGTGGGVSLAANKIKGIYCLPCESIFTAKRIYTFNKANVMAMGSMVVSRAQACEMADAYLESTCQQESLGFIQEVEEVFFK